jgi:hypothetical protein
MGLKAVSWTAGHTRPVTMSRTSATGDDATVHRVLLRGQVIRSGLAG